MKRGGPTHPKTLALAEALGITRAHAVGLLECMFHFVAQYCPEGDIGRYDDKRIAAGVGWHRAPSKLIEALVSTGWVEGHPQLRLIVHQWHMHADRATLQRLSRDGKKPVQSCHSVSGDLCTQSETSGFTLGSLPEPEPEPEPEPVVEHLECSVPVEETRTNARAENAAPSALVRAPQSGTVIALAELLELFRSFGRGCTESDRHRCERAWSKLSPIDQGAIATHIRSCLPDWQARPTEKIAQPWNYLEGRHWERVAPRLQPQQQLTRGDRDFMAAAASFIRRTS